MICCKSPIRLNLKGQGKGIAQVFKKAVYLIQIDKAMYATRHAQEKKEGLALLESQGDAHCIVLYDDDYNTFDFVIESLIDICDHAPQQAEQCTLIVHYKGKCEVKSGSLCDLSPRCKRLLQRGLTAEII